MLILRIIKRFIEKFLARKHSNLRKMETHSKPDLVKTWNYLQVRSQDCTKRDAVSSVCSCSWVVEFLFTTLKKGYYGGKEFETSWDNR